MYPTSITVNEKAIEKLTATYLRAYKEIIDELEGSTDFNKARSKQIIGEIDNALTTLGKDTQKLIETELPKQYRSGANDAVRQMRAIDAPIRVGSGFSTLHRRAIQAIVDDTSRAFAESMTGVSRSANLLFNKGLKEEITQRMAVGITRGDALRKAKQSIIGAIRDEGLYSLKDKAGRSWTLDRYSEMLFRTKSVEARNRGLTNRIVENNYDLVEVSRHGATDICGKWEGKILSLTGENSNYPTVEEATSDGLFHPNCKHAINVIKLQLAKETMGWDSKEKEYTKGLISKT